MKKIFNKENIINFFILLIVIFLYIAVFMFIYTNFRERKRKEISNNIIEKVDKEINESKDEPKEEVKAKYNGFYYTILGKIKIKKIGIYEPILKENTKRAYDASVVKMAGPKLNTYGNVSIGGHNFMRGNFFIKIKRLVNNDVVTITGLDGKNVNYYVYEYGVTTIDDSSYLKQPSNPNDRIITLVTCTKGGKERYYVKAKAK